MNTRLGHYDIVEELGRGGMGVVYKGYESSLGRYVAIKVLSAAMAHDKVFVERFLREARSMATLNDSHIIQIYFIGQDEDQTFFVMEYIDGESLAASIKRETRLEVGDALKVLLHTSQGLAAAHSHGVIHRDIKPGNIMITTRGQVKVADFGIALANRDASAKLTNAGEFVGTPGYLSPEVCLGKAVDQRSDIWALGIVLFEMLTGRMPFNDESPLRLMLDVVQADAPDIRELNPDVDEEVSRILTKMLAKDPADRYQSCDDLNEDLKKHPLVSTGGQLRLRPAPWAGANSSNPTVVGMPTPMTPGNMPRAATPPPVVSSARTPVITHAPVSSAPAPAAAAKRPTGRILAIAGAVVVLAGLGWAFGTGKFKGASPDAPATATTAPADAAPAAPAAPPTPAPPVPSAAGTEAADDLIPVPETPVAGESVTAPDADGATEAAPTTALATVRYGHGGENTKLNRIRARPDKVGPTADDLAREEARLHNIAAVEAALAAQQAAADAAAAAPVAAPQPAKKK
ncbi:MAG: serine/threonine protein kinase, partial [Arenimonas sp.]|nr:serine/threonine protein kinase [Arenimonas sp.]